MKRRKSGLLVKLVAIILVVSLCAPAGAFAAVPETATPRASQYIVSYNAYIYPAGNGDLQVWFDITGTNYWTDIGAMTVFLYESTDNENFTWLKSFLYEDNDTMMAHDTFSHMSHVDYEGIPGRYYKACVCFRAGTADDYDVRYLWTPVKLCI